MSAKHSGGLLLQVVSDLVCPWCFIGKRSLDQARVSLAAQGLTVELEWLPYQLNPDLPTEGMDRRAFRTQRFGSWENALAMDARAVEAGRKVGADFHYERQTRTSNTFAAHRLARLALIEGGPELQSRLIDAMFVAYFESGEDLGDRAVLEHLAGGVGMTPDAVHRSMLLHSGVRMLDQRLRTTGLSGVPSYLVGGELLFSGAQDVAGYVRQLGSVARRAS
jgi:predicted DsbA family dithiol-disulfide isomerase